MAVTYCEVGQMGEGPVAESDVLPRGQNKRRAAPDGAALPESGGRPGYGMDVSFSQAVALSLPGPPLHLSLLGPPLSLSLSC